MRVCFCVFLCVLWQNKEHDADQDIDVDITMLDWYMQTDFIELNTNGLAAVAAAVVLVVVPVAVVVASSRQPFAEPL